MDQLLIPSIIQILIDLQPSMSRTLTAYPAFRWEPAHDFLPITGSLIISDSPKSPTGHENKHRRKFDELGLPPSQLLHHKSQKELKKNESRKPTALFVSHELNRPYELPLQQKLSRAELEQVRHSQIFTKNTGNWRTNTEKKTLFKERNFRNQANIGLNQTSSTTTTEGVNRYKSDKTFPSFLRTQTKSPPKQPTPTHLSLRKQNFKVLKPLGQGKFGSVFLARQTLTGMIVALKVVEKKRIAQDNFLVQFIRELKIQSYLDHPNIIKIYGYFHDQLHVYIVMELGCDGQLFDLISQGQTLTEQTTSFVIGNLLSALQQMHQHKILHRDIKPQNIVLVHGNIKLCDFGWAVHKKDELRSTFCGTPLYLSPELLKGEHYDQKVDLWAAGVLAYELYYGHSPFLINNQEDLVKIITHELHFPQHKPISRQFSQFLRAILKKDPKDRLQCNKLSTFEFIRKYGQLQTCEQLCH